MVYLMVIISIVHIFSSAIICPAFTVPNNVELGDCSIPAVPGDHCEFSCATGTDLVSGSLVRVCSALGLWVEPLPVCTRKNNHICALGSISIARYSLVV